METIKCCIACILPCGALDVVRIVHSNGRVEEISGGPVLAGEIMKAYPKHVLRKPPSTCPADGGAIVVQKPVILPPNAELQRGKIYFLMPVMATAPAPAPEKPAAAKQQPPPPPAGQTTAAAAASVARRRRRRKDHPAARDGGAAAAACSSRAAAGLAPAPAEDEKERLLANERYLSEIMKEKASTARDRRRGRVAVWRPHLESITEDDL